MRITGGSLKGRKFPRPDGNGVRPASDKTRERLFTLLRHGAWKKECAGYEDFTVDDKRVLDLFCGTGSYGIEALSRGAKTAVFMDMKPYLCRESLENFDLEDRGVALRRDLRRIGSQPDGDVFDLVFIDPPYDKNLVKPILKGLMDRQWLSEKALCVVETEKDCNLDVDGFKCVDDRTSGIVRVRLFIKKEE